jgi:hypothetical protein
MNRKVNLNEEVNRINAIIENSKRINEGLYLDDKYTPEMDDTYEETPHGEPEGQEPMQQPVDNESPAEKMELVDTIRKMALKGMGELAENPESEEYQILKKVWQFCEKKPNNNNNNQPQQ